MSKEHSHGKDLVRPMGKTGQQVLDSGWSHKPAGHEQEKKNQSLKRVSHCPNPISNHRDWETPQQSRCFCEFLSRGHTASQDGSDLIGALIINEYISLGRTSGRELGQMQPLCSVLSEKCCPLDSDLSPSCPVNIWRGCIGSVGWCRTSLTVSNET